LAVSALALVPNVLDLLRVAPVRVYAVHADTIAIGLAVMLLLGAALAGIVFARLVGRYAMAARGWQQERELSRYPGCDADPATYDRAYSAAESELADAIGMTPGADPVAYVEVLEMVADAAALVASDSNAQAVDWLASALRRLDEVQQAARREAAGV
jgi:hypothetical protein